MRNLPIVFVVMLVLGAHLSAKASTSGERKQEDNERGESEAISDERDDRKVRAGFKWPEMFRFDRFKSAYNKKYSSTIEEMLRLKVFLARSYQVFLSAVAYSYRTKSYYLKLSDRTDLLPSELEARRNRHTMPEVERSGPKVQVVPSDDVDFDLIEPEELEAELDKIRERAIREPDYEKLATELNKLTTGDESARTRRKRRSVDSGEQGDRRADFNIGQAFAMVKDNSKYQVNQMKPPASNNPNWKWPELDTMGVRNYEHEPGFKEMVVREVHQRQHRTYDDLPVKSQYHLISRISSLTQVFMNEQQRARQSAKRVAKLRKAREGNNDDIVWVDHRIGGCMQPIQDQELCGSCYAFAAMAYLEWLHCMETTERVKFSEQYLVDCGVVSLEHMYGCDGGNYFQVSRFVSNFGLELAEHYPYFGYRSNCPYEPQEEMHKMGYLRADVSDILLIDLKYAETYLDRSPLLVNIITTNIFHLYGGGVYDGKGCAGKNKTDHSVLMIGHGREDGEEYWLLRNSYGPGWGEEGYLKLNKNSKCITPSEGAIYRSTDGRLVPLGATRNDQLPEPVKLKRKTWPVMALLTKLQWAAER